MNIFEYMKRKILSFLGLEHLHNNPDDKRLTYINDADAIKSHKVKEAKIWAYGDSSELDNFYRVENVDGFPANPIYTENMKQYFRAKSIEECGVKKVHSGVPHAIIEVLVNSVGVPIITSKDIGTNLIVEKIIKENNLMNIINQEQLPMTLIEGWGAFKINFDTDFSDTPIVEYYDAENVEFAVKCNRIVGVVFKDFYEHDGKKYMLLETRRVASKNSIIEYELFRLKGNNSIVRVPLKTIPELTHVSEDGFVIEGLNRPLAVASKMFFDPLNKDYGRSIFSGKIDLFDDLDQILSQASQTVRVSTPVEYFRSDALRKDKFGNTALPNIFNRQYIQAPDTIPNGDGLSVDKQIETTQPVLNFGQYSEEAKAKLDFILTGLLSPSTLGMDMTKRDNAESQREKEKVTIMTRNNIIDREVTIIKELIEDCIIMQEFMTTGSITLNQNYELSVQFEEFANPTMEQKLSVYGLAFSQGIVSEKMVVNSIYGNDISEEEKQHEIDFIHENKNSDNLMLGDFTGLGNGNT